MDHLHRNVDVWRNYLKKRSEEVTRSIQLATPRYRCTAQKQKSDEIYQIPNKIRKIDIDPDSSLQRRKSRADIDSVSGEIKRKNEMVPTSSITTNLEEEYLKKVSSSFKPSTSILAVYKA